MNQRMISARVIARLKVMYPAYARSMENDSDMMDLAIDEWSVSLQGLSLDDIAAGFEKLRIKASPFCPSIPEFLGMCGGKVRPWYQTLEGYVERGKQLGIDEKDYVRKDHFIDLVKSKARESGEELPFFKSKKKEALPVGAAKLVKGMTVGSI